jgi:RNA polymerase sigma-B factor
MTAASSRRGPRASAPTQHRCETVRWCTTDALLSRWREGGDRGAREELVLRFLPLAHRLAGHYHTADEPIEDLVQVASLGLIGAVDRFDPARGIPFPAFAIPSIVGELKHSYRSTGWAAHVPPGAQELALRVDRAARRITAQSGRRAAIGELADLLALTAEDVRAATGTATGRYAISLDTQIPANDSHGANALLDDIAAVDDNYDLVETALSVSAAATLLPDLELQAVTLRLDCAMNQTEIARRLNCSQTHVSHLLRHAAGTLQELIDPPLGRAAASPSAERRPAPAADVDAAQSSVRAARRESGRVGPSRRPRRPRRTRPELRPTR